MEKTLWFMRYELSCAIIFSRLEITIIAD